MSKQALEIIKILRDSLPTCWKEGDDIVFASDRELRFAAEWLQEASNSLTAKDEAFEEFWKLYPRRVARAQAEKAWAQMRGNLHLSDIKANIAARLRIGEWEPATKMVYIPHAATYLRGQRWLDPLTRVEASQWYEK